MVLAFGQAASASTVPGSEAIALAETFNAAKTNKSKKSRAKKKPSKNQSSSEKNEGLGDAEAPDDETMDGVEEDGTFWIALSTSIFFLASSVVNLFRV